MKWVHLPNFVKPHRLQNLACPRAPSCYLLFFCSGLLQYRDSSSCLLWFNSGYSLPKIVLLAFPSCPGCRLCQWQIRAGRDNGRKHHDFGGMGIAKSSMRPVEEMEGIMAVSIQSFLSFSVLLQVLGIAICAGLIGWITNWLAVQLTFYPVEFRGLGRWIGWQGIIPAKAEKMATIVVERSLSRDRKSVV